MNVDLQQLRGSYRTRRKHNLFKTLRWLLLILGIIAIIPLGIAAITLTRIWLGVPDPTGPEQIGRIQQAWIDETRNERYAEGRKREVIAEIWYPAMEGTGDSMSYASK